MVCLQYDVLPDLRIHAHPRAVSCNTPGTVAFEIIHTFLTFRALNPFERSADGFLDTQAGTIGNTLLRITRIFWIVDAPIAFPTRFAVHTAAALIGRKVFVPLHTDAWTILESFLRVTIVPFILDAFETLRTRLASLCPTLLIELRGFGHADSPAIRSALFGITVISWIIDAYFL